MRKKIIGSKILTLDTIPSTNTYLQELLTHERPSEGTTVITHNQTSGRGMNTNRWESESGKNLTFSFVLYPHFLPPENQFLLNQAISLGVTDLIFALIPCKITVKWPNDIYIDEKKVCGILIQNSVQGRRFDFMIAGIGLNVNQKTFSPDLPNPVSLIHHTGALHDMNALFSSLLSYLDNRYDMLQSGKQKRINDDYIQRLYRFGEWHSYLVHGKKTDAKISGINSYGQLMLENREGAHWNCDLKEVVYL